MSTLRVTGLKQETSSATNISMAVGGGVTVAGIATFHNNAIFTNDVTVTGNISVGGTLTYQDVTDVDSIGIITARAGVDITGGSLNIDGNVASTTQFSGFDALRIHNNNGSVFGVTADMYFTAGTSSSNRGAAIGSELVSGFGNDLYFATNGGNVSSTNTLTERLRITSGGNVGIGTDNPNQPLHIHANGTSYVRFTDETSGIGATDGVIFGLDHPHLYAWNYEAGDFVVATNATEKFRIDSNNTIHIGNRDGNQNSTHFGTSRLSICGPDPIPTSVSKAGSYLAIGNNESELNGVYPITFGFTTNTNSHQPAYIAYKTTDAGGSEKGDLLFGTRNVTTDTEPTERLRITSAGDLLHYGSTTIPGGTTVTKRTDVSANGTLDMQIPGVAYVGHLYVMSIFNANASVRTSRVYFITGRYGNSPVVTQLQTDNGSNGGKAFTITDVSAGSSNLIRFTDTSSSAVQVSMHFVGAIGL